MTASKLLRSLVRGAEELLQPRAYLLLSDSDAFTHLPESIELSGGASAMVVRATTELHLRHALWQAQGRPVLAVIPQDMDCPADLREQAVKHKIHTLSNGEVLQTVLGTRVIGVDDAELNQLAIDHAEQIRQRLNLQTTPTVVDRALLERTLVEVVGELADLGLNSGELGPLVARWALDPPEWSSAVQKLAERVLQQQGPFGQIVAWAVCQDNGCHDLVVHGAVLSAQGELSEGAWGPLAYVRDNPDDFLLDRSAVRSHLVSLATQAIAELGHSAHGLLNEADTVARHSVHGTALRASNLLPLAFQERAHDIAVRLASGHADVAKDLRALDNHTLAPTRRHELELLEEMARLARYLAMPRAELHSASALASAYATDHAFADLCVRRLERALAQTTVHRDAAKQLIERVITARDALNHQWAERLQRGYRDILFAEPKQSLPNLTRAYLADELVNKRAFLLVLDGCSLPVWFDLLDQLSTLPQPIGLERRVSKNANHASDTSVFALSPLPTITSHARGALFLGSVPRDAFIAETKFADDVERKTDPARFNQNPSLGTHSRKLFLKGDLTDDSIELQRALASDIQVVAAVYNAVDDRIGSHDTGQAWRMHVGDIRGLIPTLQTAIAQGRSILVTADHGHSPFRGNSGFVGAGSTPRYITLGAKDPVPDGFIEIDCAGLSGHDGRMAFAWKQGVYRGQQQVGFHGGCGLEEMVVPVAWLQSGSDNIARPAWWHTLVAGAPEPEVTAQQREAELRSRPSATTSLPSASHRQDTPAVDVSVLPTNVREQLSDADQRVLAYIHQHRQVRTGTLATFAGRPSNRMRGYLAQLTRKLLPLGVQLTGTDLPDGEKQWSIDLP